MDLDYALTSSDAGKPVVAEDPLLFLETRHSPSTEGYDSRKSRLREGRLIGFRLVNKFVVVEFVESAPEVAETDSTGLTGLTVGRQLTAQYGFDRQGVRMQTDDPILAFPQVRLET